MTAVLIAVFVGSLILGLYLRRRRVEGSLSRNRRLLAMLLPIVFLLCCFQVYTILGRGLTHTYHFVAVACWASLPLLIAYGLCRRPTKAEELWNFARNRTRCGRCEYDLTGNVTGICPECGWEIPQGKIQLESREWMLWWKGWEIDYLIDWRRSLAVTAANTFLLTAVSVWFICQIWVPLGLVGILLAVCSVHR
jgi:hypothetical protein